MSRKKRAQEEMNAVIVCSELKVWAQQHSVHRQQSLDGLERRESQVPAPLASRPGAVACSSHSRPRLCWICAGLWLHLEEGAAVAAVGSVIVAVVSQSH